MDCRKVKQLLPLWVGQDLPDSASTADVAGHLGQCPTCDEHRRKLQLSLEVLQGSTAETLSNELSRRSVWPKLVSRISHWENDRRRERFNGWIPASVMALAVILMVAVSIPSIHEEFSGSGSNSTADLFQSDSPFSMDAGSNANRDPFAQPRPQGLGTPVKYSNRPENW